MKLRSALFSTLVLAPIAGLVLACGPKADTATPEPAPAPAPSTVNRSYTTVLTLDELELWADRILDARELNEVFGA